VKPKVPLIAKSLVIFLGIILFTSFNPDSGKMGESGLSKIDKPFYHPGHYILTSRRLSEDDPDLIRWLQSESIRGVQSRFTWRELETAKGVYNPAPIIDELKALYEFNKDRNDKKYIIIFFQFKTFRDSDIGFPDYILPDSSLWYFKGYKKANNKSGGRNVVWWDDRIKVLFEGMLKNVFSEVMKAPYSQYLEGVYFNEALPGFPDIPEPEDLDYNTHKEKYAQTMAYLLSVVRESTGGRMAGQYTNDPAFWDEFQAKGMGLGKPNARLTDEGQLLKMKEIAGNWLPVNVSPQPETYAEEGQSIETILERLVRLNVNYASWFDYKKEIDELIKLLESQRVKYPLPAGGLNTLCPGSVSSWQK
jgi:hypothetical protein